ncbi:unnamed protein product [Hermetia illucens]|uniref:Uncharacterized protein n=1 Tax=Hermetia illucens TaxID=343691 RepID=A0A7R8YW47_HERIL|nr:unnamed protein product [Hermetia illucens]
MGILERWVEYFDELLNNQNIGELEVSPTKDDGQILPQPSSGETVRAIHRLKNHKSPGADGITVELVKYGGDQLHQVVHHHLCSRYGTANQCLTIGNEASSVSYIKREISRSAAII